MCWRPTSVMCPSSSSTLPSVHFLALHVDAGSRTGCGPHRQSRGRTTSSGQCEADWTITHMLGVTACTKDSAPSLTANHHITNLTANHHITTHKQNNLPIEDRPHMNVYIGLCTYAPFDCAQQQVPRSWLSEVRAGMRHTGRDTQTDQTHYYLHSQVVIMTLTFPVRASEHFHI